MTDSCGRALIPRLRSYQRNKITIDTTKLPVDADIATTESMRHSVGSSRACD